MKLGLIGNGAIAGQMLDALAASGHADGIDEIVCLGRAASAARAEALFTSAGNGAFAGRTRLVHELDDLIAAKVDLVVEAAGHGAVSAYGPALLEGGNDFLICSVGSLSDSALHARLLDAAQKGGAQLHLPAGAVGAIDLLAALRLGGVFEVTYVSRKPPMAWTGTPAEEKLDLAAIGEATVFFEGTARDAARDYPKNANVAATVALAGLGFDETRVRMIADPDAGGNVHRIEVRSAAADFSIEIAGKPSLANPKTSAGTGLSVARLVLNRIAQEVI